MCQLFGVSIYTYTYIHTYIFGKRNILHRNYIAIVIGIKQRSLVKKSLKEAIMKKVNVWTGAGAQRSNNPVQRSIQQMNNSIAQMQRLNNRSNPNIHPTIHVNDNPLDILRTNVQKSKKQVQSNIQQLERLRNNIVQDTISKIKNHWIEQMQRHNDYSNPTIDAIRKEVEAAKAEGKNAQPCYDTAFNTLRNIWKTAEDDAQQCVDNAKSSIKSELSFIDNLISTGWTLVTTLDSIFPNCFSNDISKMQTCITLKLATVNTDVKILQDNANSAESTAQSASNNIVLQGNNCVDKVHSSAFSQITEVRLAATKCLEAL